MKTQSFVINKDSNPSNTLTTKQLHTIQVEQRPQELKTIREQVQDIKEGAHDTRRIKHINQLSSYFPKFYKKEIKNALAIFIVWLCLLCAALGAMAYGIFVIVTSQDSN